MSIHILTFVYTQADAIVQGLVELATSAGTDPRTVDMPSEPALLAMCGAYCAELREVRSRRRHAAPYTSMHNLFMRMCIHTYMRMSVDMSIPVPTWQ